VGVPIVATLDHLLAKKNGRDDRPRPLQVMDDLPHPIALNQILDAL
jgi:hypothetical protein